MSLQDDEDMAATMLRLTLVFIYIFLPDEVMLRPFFDKNVEDYLTQFGYLPRSIANSMRSWEHMENAVKNLQFYAGLNVSGVIDEPTLNLMSK